TKRNADNPERSSASAIEVSVIAAFAVRLMPDQGVVSILARPRAERCDCHSYPVAAVGFGSSLRIRLAVRATAARCTYIITAGPACQAPLRGYFALLLRTNAPARRPSSGGRATTPRA